MPIAKYSFETAQDNLKSDSRTRWPDGRRDGSRLEGIVTVDTRATFELLPGEAIFTVGSCFARNVERRLEQQGFDVVTKTRADGLGLDETGRKENAFLNKYTPYAILNEFAWGLDPDAVYPPEAIVEGEDGLWYDPHVLYSTPGAPRESVVRRREAVIALYSQLKTCRVVVMTLGLIESWFDTVTGIYINGIPPASVVKRHPGRFELHVLTASEVVDCLESIHDLLRRFGHPDFRLLITVSPVPFKATFTGQDAISANTYSKSALRAATEEFVARHPDVDYFPSYEIATLTNRSSAFIEDNIHVTVEVVDTIMDGVMSKYVPSLFARPAQVDTAEARSVAIRARRMADAGDMAKAAKLLHTLAQDDAWRLTDMDEFEFRFLYGRAMATLGKLVAGEVQLRKAFSLAPESAPVSFHLGLTRRKLGRQVEAEEFLRRAVKLDPKRKLYRMMFARQLIQLSRHAEAERQLGAILAETPDDAEALELRKECRDAIAKQDAQAQA